MLTDPRIRAVVPPRGGETAIDLLPFLDWDLVAAADRPGSLAGFFTEANEILVASTFGPESPTLENRLEHRTRQPTRRSLACNCHAGHTAAGCRQQPGIFAQAPSRTSAGEECHRGPCGLACERGGLLGRLARRRWA